MHYRVQRSVALALGACLPLAGLSAASTVDDELREVIVTARSIEVTTPLELSRFGNEVFFLPAEKIANHGFVDTTQAIEMLVPGVFLATQAGAFSYVNMSLQGSRNGDVLWTLDGVRINNRLYRGTSPADTLPASMIERVEVLKGGQGLLYGTQAVAGVINVVTHGFSDELDGSVSVGGDSNSGLHLDGYARGALGNHRFVAWASKNETDGYQLYDALQPNATTRDRRYDVNNFGLKYGYEFGDRARLTLQAIHTDAALDYPNTTYTDVNDRDEDILIARLDVDVSETVEMYLKGYLHDWDTDYYPALDPDDSAYWGFTDKGLSAAARIAPGGALEYHVGYDYQTYTGRDEVLLIEEQSETVHAVYGQVRSTDALSESTRFSAGLRYNSADASDATVWSLSGVHEFSDALFVEALVGTSFVLPDAYQLFAVDPFEPLGNPDLQPEESLAFNLSFGGLLPLGQRSLEWRLSGWKRTVENLIVSDDSNPPSGFDSVFINIDDDVEVHGASISVRSQVAAGLSADASFTYSREQERGMTRQLADRPLHSGKLGLSWSPAGGRYGADVALKYFGTTRTSVTGFGEQLYGGDFIANLGLHLFADAEQRHRFGLRVENLFDTDYATRIRSAVLAGSSPATRFMYRNLGPSRTAFFNYTYNF